MQFGEDLLVDPGVLIGLAPVDNNQSVTQLSLDDRLDDRIKEVLYIRIIVMLGIQQTHRERRRSLQ